MDPASCVLGAIDTNPPYSCGSPARQAVIKYFFRDYLQGTNNNATLGRIVASLVDDLTEAWNDTSRYACLCPDLSSHSVLCCVKNASAVGAGAWLPLRWRWIPSTCRPTVSCVRSPGSWRRSTVFHSRTRLCGPSTLTLKRWRRTTGHTRLRLLWLRGGAVQDRRALSAL